jgi:sarcosine dehydrogenase
MQLIAHTRHLALTLEQETGVSTGFVEAGGLFIATTKERLFEDQRLTTLGKYFGIESSILSPSETKALYPLINADDLYCSLHSHGDGTIDPSGWVAALARGAKQRGATIREHATVTAIHSESAPHTVHTRGPADRQVTGVELSTGEVIRTSAVINCAGVWAPNVGALVGADVPLCAMRHAYVTTEPIPGIENMPNIRDHDASVYLKVQGNSIHIGGYEKNPIFWKDVQQDFAFSLFDLDWEVFSAHIEGAVQRLPVLETTGVQSTVCGPESFTADHKPLMGPVPGIRGFYLVTSQHT